MSPLSGHQQGLLLIPGFVIRRNNIMMDRSWGVDRLPSILLLRFFHFDSSPDGARKPHHRATGQLLFNRNTTTRRVVAAVLSSSHRIYPRNMPSSRPASNEMTLFASPSELTTCPARCACCPLSRPAYVPALLRATGVLLFSHRQDSLTTACSARRSVGPQVHISVVHPGCAPWLLFSNRPGCVTGERGAILRMESASRLVRHHGKGSISTHTVLFPNSSNEVNLRSFEQALQDVMQEVEIRIKCCAVP